MIDSSFLQLTPGTRDGIIFDDAYESFAVSLEDLSLALEEIIEEQRKAEEDKTSRKILHRITKAIREALHFLPEQEYGWLSVAAAVKTKTERPAPEQTDASAEAAPPVYVVEDSGAADGKEQREFFEIPGSLFSAVISPSRVILGVGKKKRLKLIARDKRRIQLDGGFNLEWEIREGEGEIDNPDKEFIEFTAPEDPGLTILACRVTQNETVVEAECLITVTEELIKSDDSAADMNKHKKGLPGYTYQKAPGELWRSHYDRERGLIVINNGHADFVFASKQKSRKLRYITKLFAKELVLENFPEVSREQLLERMIELQIYAEENL
jgi:hypothetical protein